MRGCEMRGSVDGRDVATMAIQKLEGVTGGECDTMQVL